MDSVTGVITTVAGNGESADSGDGGPATAAGVGFPDDVAVDGLGNLYIAESRSRRVRVVDAASGVISTLAGIGEAGFSGDGGPASSATLNNPASVTLDADDNLFISDRSNGRVRRVDAATGIITTVAGTGDRGFSGDGGLATGAGLDPVDVAVDRAGNLLIADSSNHRVRRVDAATGVMATVAGTGEDGHSGDGGLATSAILGFPQGVAIDGNGNLLVADGRSHRIRMVTGIAAAQVPELSIADLTVNEGAGSAVPRFPT